MRRIVMTATALAAITFTPCAVAGEDAAPQAAATPAAPSAPADPAEEKKTLYALGAALARNITAFEFTEEELKGIQAGFADGVLNRELAVQLEEYGPRIDPYLQARIARLTETEKMAGAAFRDEKAKLPGAETTATGVVYRELAAGTGASPAADDTVKINYTGTLRDGMKFDSSFDGPDPGPVSFSLKGVIPCFSEGVQKMKVGGKSELVCPPEAAYGDRGSAPLIKPGSTLVFEVELVEIVPKADPAGEAAPPAADTPAPDAPTP